ncbi:trypsin-like peptidase domain-containing protein [Mycobacterium sp.]|uniref:trypsin-like peptidase domain-containing protein n=1 Tax=Mycobacterium sp. TaxID=1785 RepID=UPI003D0D5D21
MSDNVPDPNAGETVHVTIQISRESLCSLPIRMYWFPDGANMAGLEGLPTGRPLGDGTAFLYRYDGNVYLVTAGHNFSGRHAENDQLGSRGVAPTHIRIGLRSPLPPGGHNLREPFSIKRLLLPIVDADDNPLWLEHPHYGRRVDIAVLPFDVTDPTVQIEAYEAEPTKPPTATDPRMRPTEDLFVVGFPYGLQTGIDLPLWIRGTIASEPAFYWRSDLGQELPLFLVDSRTREGQSGAPVIFFRPPNTLFLSEQQQLSYTKGSQSKLLGVYSGRAFAKDDTGSSDLGFCWRISEVRTICTKQVRAKRVANSGISDHSEQVLFDHLSDDDLVTLLANSGGALSTALVTRLALIPGGLPGRAEWVSDLSTDTETVRLSEQLRERLTSQRERLTLWWEQLKPNDRRYITEHRAGALAADYAEIISAASELAATKNDGAEFLLPTIIRVFVEWKMSE